MDESAQNYLRRVRFLSLYTADIAYIQEEKEFYFDKVKQPISYSFVCGETKLVVEIDHLVDFTLKNNWVIHEKIPQGRIIAARTIEYEGVGRKSIEETPANLAIEDTPAAESESQDVVVVVLPTTENE